MECLAYKLAHWNEIFLCKTKQNKKTKFSQPTNQTNKNSKENCMPESLAPQKQKTKWQQKYAKTWSHSLVHNFA